MIPIVEDELKAVIEKRLKDLKTETDIIDRIFPTLTQSVRLQIKEYLSRDQLKVIRGFPRDQNHIPAFVILLGSEQETQQSIGDYVGEDENYYEVEEVIEEQEVKTIKGMDTVVVDKKPITEILSVEHNGISYVDSFDILDYEKGEVVLYGEIPVDHGDTVKITYERKSEGNEFFGTIFESQYRIETWTSNGDLTMYLYHLLRYILIQSRHELQGKGLIIQKIAGTDFEPAPEYFPTFVYRRALLFSTSYEITTDSKYPFISDVNADLKED